MPQSIISDVSTWTADYREVVSRCLSKLDVRDSCNVFQDGVETLGHAAKQKGKLGEKIAHDLERMCSFHRQKVPYLQQFIRYSEVNSLRVVLLTCVEKKREKGHAPSM